jgi:3-hydroxybutyryl-CoA dehydrogenase
MHFFNPVALMKLVEVVHGLQTDPAVAERIGELSRTWGKVPVHAKSTPGFIVNRIARPYYAETLALLQERAAPPSVLDACLRGAGFRMGPCELMDLIGHDTNFAVTETVYAANFGDKRYAPSLVQRELVDGGLLGRKTGRGFFDYGGDSPQAAAPQGAESVVPPPAGIVVLHGHGLAVERWAAALDRAGRPYARDAQSGWSGLSVDSAQLRLTDGRPAGMVAAREQVRELALFDLSLPIGGVPSSALAWCAATTASDAWREQAVRWLQVAGWQPRQVADAAGLVVARTLAMLINEASDAVLQGVCTAEAADAAMKLGVNYPAGPFEWLAAWDARAVVRLLDHLDEHYRGERYRVSPALRQRGWALESHS